MFLRQGSRYNLPLVTASNVCSWTPFLVPSQALKTACCSPVPIFSRAFADSKKQRINRRKRKLRNKALSKHDFRQLRFGLPTRSGVPPKSVDQQIENIDDFRGQIFSGDVENAMASYGRLLPSGLLEDKDGMNLSHLLHNYYRNNEKLPGPMLDRLHGYVGALVSDMKGGKVPGHPVTSLHLLSYFKSSRRFEEGQKLWFWLESQDANYTDARTYGAAIELLAYKGEPLQKLEALFAKAIQLFPDGFSEYHLSPEGVVPDRDQGTNVRARMLLLQGILTARILNGDWRKAYAALDTALRLHPYQVPLRFFTLFMLHRPLQEGYKIFLLACRSSSRPASSTLSTLLERLLKSQHVAEYSHARTDPMALAMLHLIRAYVTAAGELNGTHLTRAMNGILFLGRPAKHARDEVEKKETPGTDSESIANGILLGAVLRLMDIFETLGIEYRTSFFNQMLSVAARRRWTDAADLLTMKMNEAGLTPNIITYRVLLKAAGALENLEQVQAGWEALIAQLNIQVNAPPEPGIRDWKALVRAGRRCDHGLDYAREEILKHGSRMDPADREEIELEISNYESELASAKGNQYDDDEQDKVPARSKRVEPEEQDRKFEAVASEVQAKVNEVQSRLSLPAQTPEELFERLRDVNHPFTMPWLPEYKLRTLYEEMTTSGPPTASSAESETSPSDDVASTSLKSPLAVARYENWKAINELLFTADAHEKMFEKLKQRQSNHREGVDEIGYLDYSFINFPSRKSAGPNGAAIQRTGVWMPIVPTVLTKAKIWELRRPR